MIFEKANYLRNATVVVGSVTLSTTWTESNGVYSQAVTISGVTSNSKIDLQPDATVLDQMQTDGTTALWAVNDNGTVTVYAMGVAPTVALTLQYIRTEVSA